MNKIQKIQAKIQKIQTLCAEVLNELEELQREDTSNRSQQPTNIDFPSEEECREAFDHLYELYQSGNPKAIDDFVSEKSKDYLKVFCKVNSLSADVKKVAKQKLVDEIRQWFAQRKALTGS